VADECKTHPYEIFSKKGEHIGILLRLLHRRDGKALEITGVRMNDEERAVVTLRLPSTLSAYSGGKSQIVLQANTVEQMLEVLRLQHPLIWERLCTEQGKIRDHVKIFVHNQLISGLVGLQTALTSGQEIIVLPAVFNV
jgi:molybdopterin converting factor small subunit